VPPPFSQQPTTGHWTSPPPPQPSVASDSSSRGKSSAAVPLLKWSGIGQPTSLPVQLTVWCTSAPEGTFHQTPTIAGKYLCFKFCTKGLFCWVTTGRQCMFTHVDLAQPCIWNRDNLKPLTEFLAKPDVHPLGLSLTPAGVRATSQTPP